MNLKTTEEFCTSSKGLGKHATPGCTCVTPTVLNCPRFPPFLRLPPPAVNGPRVLGLLQLPLFPLSWVALRTTPCPCAPPVSGVTPQPSPAPVGLPHGCDTHSRAGPGCSAGRGPGFSLCTRSFWALILPAAHLSASRPFPSTLWVRRSLSLQGPSTHPPVGGDGAFPPGGHLTPPPPTQREPGVSSAAGGAFPTFCTYTLVPSFP